MPMVSQSVVNERCQYAIGAIHRNYTYEIAKPYSRIFMTYSLVMRKYVPMTF